VYLNLENLENKKIEVLDIRSRNAEATQKATDFIKDNSTPVFEILSKLVGYPKLERLFDRIKDNSVTVIDFSSHQERTGQVINNRIGLHWAIETRVWPIKTRDPRAMISSKEIIQQVTLVEEILHRYYEDDEVHKAVIGYIVTEIYEPFMKAIREAREVGIYLDEDWFNNLDKLKGVARNIANIKTRGWDWVEYDKAITIVKNIAINKPELRQQIIYFLKIILNTSDLHPYVYEKVMNALAFIPITWFPSHTNGSYPADMPTSDEPDRVPTRKELKRIISAFGGKNALAAKGITLDAKNVRISPCLAAPAEVRGGVLYVNPNTLRGPPKQLRVIFKGHELFHLLYPKKSEE